MTSKTKPEKLNKDKIKSFDDFYFDLDCYNEIKEKIRDYTVNSSKITEGYVHNRKLLLEFNLSILIVFTTVISICFQINYYSKIQIIPFSIIIPFIWIGLIYLGITIWNIFYNLMEHRTFREGIEEDQNDKNFWRTNWFYRGHIDETENILIKIKKKIKGKKKKKSISTKYLKKKVTEFIENLIKDKTVYNKLKKLKDNLKQNLKRKKKKKSIDTEYLKKKLIEFTKNLIKDKTVYNNLKKPKDNLNQNLNFKQEMIKDDIKNLFKLYNYSSNYYSIAMGTRYITKIGLYFLLISVAIFLFIYFIGFKIW